VRIDEKRDVRICEHTRAYANTRVHLHGEVETGVRVRTRMHMYGGVHAE